MPNPFIVGNKIRRTGPNFSEVQTGEIFTIERFYGPGKMLGLVGLKGTYDYDKFELVKKEGEDRSTCDEPKGREEKKMTELTPGKQYLINGGPHPVVFVGFLSNGDRVIEGYVSKTPHVVPSDRVLTEYVEPKKGKVWLNVYDSGATSVYRHRDDADRTASADFHINNPRIACVEVDWVEGQGL